MEKFKHLNKEAIEVIEHGLTTCKTPQQLANEVHFDFSNLIKHIKNIVPLMVNINKSHIIY